MLSFASLVWFKVALHVYQVVPDSMKLQYLLHSFAAAISDTISTTIATTTASNLTMKWDLFVFDFFLARYLDPILLLVRALELWTCRGILGCRCIPRFCLYLLNVYHFIYTFSHAHTEAHTHKHTCTISTQETWRQPGTGAWLREAEERLC